MHRHPPAPFALLLVALVLGAGCSDDPTGPPPRYEATGTASGEIAPAGRQVLRCVSAKGPVTVQAEGLSAVRWYLYKYVTAPTREQANDGLAQIGIASGTVADSLVFDVTTPPSGEIYYSAAVTLGIPFELGCAVDNATAAVQVSDLFRPLRVRGAAAVTVRRHNASCDVATSRGAVYVEAAVPDSGYCLAGTGEGDVELHLPADASARIWAHTDAGAVSVIGLTLTDRADSTGYVSGTLGTGTAAVRLTTQKGNITIRAL
jgi:hypothetical protein